MTIKPRAVDQRVRYDFIFSALPELPARICEVGVGHGWLLRRLYELSYEVHGCDVNPNAMPPSSPIASRVVQSSGARLPFPDNHFDATYSCDVLEHVAPAERAAFLAEMVRVTKPGGMVALTAFFRNTLSFRLWGVGYLFLRGTLPAWYTEHLTIPLPSEDDTFEYLNQNLVAIKRVRYQRSLNIFVMWLQSVSPRQRHLAKLFDLPGILVPRCDIVGATTSTFFVGTKPI